MRGDVSVREMRLRPFLLSFLESVRISPSGHVLKCFLAARRVCNITNIPCLDESIGGSIEIRAKFETSCSRHDPGQHHQSLQLPLPVRGHVLQRDVLHGHLGQQRSRPHLLVLVRTTLSNNFLRQQSFIVGRTRT
jgi:hypothetical protein